LKVKVSAVSYLNTLPFIYGIKHSDVKDELDLSLDIPSDCAKKLLSGEVDLGLVPVAIISQLKEYHIISDYCIGAYGKVDSVALYSDVPLNEIENIYLDYHSRTSVALVQLLAKEHWKIKPNWLKADSDFIDKIEGTTAGVIIGDRTFRLPKEYKYKYDLAEEWLNYTDLPFVFACWVSNKKLTNEFISKFNLALFNGVQSINKVVEMYSESSLTKQELEDYLTNKISFSLDVEKRKALEHFLKAIETIK
jgi:chorismate dehydratase